MACVGEVKDFYVGSIGELLVEIKYALDGVDEPSVDRKTYFPETLKGKTKEEIAALIQNDIKARCEQIILYKYKQVVGTSPQVENRISAITPIYEDMSKDKKFYQDISLSIAEAKLAIDSNSDSIPDQEWSIKSDGTKIITNMTP